MRKWIITVEKTVEVFADKKREAMEKALSNQGEEIHQKVVGIGIEDVTVENIEGEVRI